MSIRSPFSAILALVAAGVFALAVIVTTAATVAVQPPHMQFDESIPPEVLALINVSHAVNISIPGLGPEPAPSGPPSAPPQGPPIPQDMETRLHWDGNWTGNRFWCDAGAVLMSYHYDCGCSANATWYACSAAQDVTASLSASKTTIERGESVTLNWSSINATQCTGTRFNTGEAYTGSSVVSPESTTQYSVTCARRATQSFDRAAWDADANRYYGTPPNERRTLVELRIPYFTERRQESAWRVQNRIIRTEFKQLPNGRQVSVGYRYDEWVEPNINDYYRTITAGGVPATRTVTVTVLEPPSNAPSTPALSPTSESGNGGEEGGGEDTGVCIVGEPYTIYMSATDPQGDDIRYQVDWDSDDTVDLFIPADGTYLPSGTVRGASRTYTTHGEYRVRVRAEDPGANTSGWSDDFVFTCSDERPPETPNVSTATGSQCTPDAPQEVRISAGHPAGKEVYYELDWNRDGSTDTRLPASGTVAAGTALTTNHTFTEGDYAFAARSVDEDGAASAWTTITGTCGASDSGCSICAGDNASVSLSAQPSLVARDQRATLSWEIGGASGIRECTLTGNGETVAWDTIRSSTAYVTAPITAPAQYTLSCTYIDVGEVADSVTVFLVPDWQEF